MTLAQRVRDCRYSKGWGPDDLASRAAISRTALYQIESGRTELPRAASLRRIAGALEVPIEALLGAQGATPQRASTHGRAALGRGEPLGRDRRLGEEMAFATSEPTGVSREEVLASKLRALLRSPLGESVSRILEEAHRLLPMRYHPPSK